MASLGQGKMDDNHTLQEPASLPSTPETKPQVSAIRAVSSSSPPSSDPDSFLLRPSTPPTSTYNYRYSAYPGAVNVGIDNGMVCSSGNGNYMSSPLMSPLFCPGPSYNRQIHSRTYEAATQYCTRPWELGTPETLHTQQVLDRLMGPVQQVGQFSAHSPIRAGSIQGKPAYAKTNRSGAKRSINLANQHQTGMPKSSIYPGQRLNGSPKNILAGFYAPQMTTVDPASAIALAQVAQQAAYHCHTRYGSSSSLSSLSYVKPRNEEQTLAPEVMQKVNLGNPIPAAVPSLFAAPSVEEALEHSMYNPNNTTNVYIRGLPPDTVDESLVRICERFGEIVSSKAIIDAESGSCKGFGFACFKNETDAQNCITGLIYCGYQVSFAKESFSTRLKSLQDPQSTNLYLSNLPLSMHEKDLEELFQPYKVLSNRILRDANNVSRGVGFARMDDRATADMIIAKFDNKLIGDNPSDPPLQVRYADSPNQKRLKGQTQKRRQWRAREYNILTGRYTGDEPFNYDLLDYQQGPGLLYLDPFAIHYARSEDLQYSMAHLSMQVGNARALVGHENQDGIAER